MHIQKIPGNNEWLPKVVYNSGLNNTTLIEKAG